MLGCKRNLSAAKALSDENFQCFSFYWKCYLSHRYLLSLVCLLGHFLSYSFQGHICSLMEDTAVSQLMAKRRKPGLLLTPSSLVHNLSSSWLSGESENDHPEVQRV